MSLTSYRAAPPRDKSKTRRKETWACASKAVTYEWVFQIRAAPAARPGRVLLFHRLSDSTIGAAWFHGRVRDGIGWVTGAMTTKP